ncbi:MAG: chromate resistance protein ChrB domain-containing protein [Chthoniobacterales bacterium]
MPATHKTARVALWRKLQRSGAIQIKTSTYLLPDRPQQYELFQWLAKQVVDYGGDSTLVRAQQIEGLADAKIVALFNGARDDDYAVLAEGARKLLAGGPKASDKRFAAGVERLRKDFRNISEVDFFAAPKAHVVESLLERLERGSRTKIAPAKRLSTSQFHRRTWVTRPRPEIDRVACAWLIREFIDPKATFKFAGEPESIPGGVPFDYSHGEFSHHGDDCTFETLLARFGIADKAARKIGEMVHDADLEDEKFQVREGIGLDRVFKGWAKRGMPDDEILVRGAACLDGLYAFLRRL